MTETDVCKATSIWFIVNYTSQLWTMRDKLHGRLLTESAVHSGKSIDFTNYALEIQVMIWVINACMCSHSSCPYRQH